MHHSLTNLEHSARSSGLIMVVAKAHISLWSLLEHNFAVVFCWLSCSTAQIHQLHEVFLIALGAAPASHVFVFMFWRDLRIQSENKPTNIKWSKTQFLVRQKCVCNTHTLPKLGVLPLIPLKPLEECYHACETTLGSRWPNTLDVWRDATSEQQWMHQPITRLVISAVHRPCE